MDERSERVLGVLGGMGPLASAQFMLRLTLLTPAERDQDHVPAVLWSDPRVPSRTQATFTAAQDPLPWLLRGVAGLRHAGCGAIAIPCNTAHRWHAEMLTEAGCPVLHIVDAAAADLRREGIAPGVIGVIGTAATLDMRLYQERLGRSGWDCLVPSWDEMQRLIGPAIVAVKTNRVAEAYAPAAEVVQSLHRRGARAVVLGCTEIPLGIQAGPWQTLGVKLIDTIDSLARASIAWARGEDC